MRIRSAEAIALTLWILLPLLLESAGHELLCHDEPKAPQLTASSLLSEPQIGSGEEEQDEDCLCCGLCSPRTSVGASSTANPALVVADSTIAQRDDLFVAPFPASHPSRGPPVR